MRDGRKHSATELAVDDCQVCGRRLKDEVIDAPLKGTGQWNYMCPNCADEYAQPTMGTIHKNIPLTLRSSKR